MEYHRRIIQYNKKVQIEIKTSKVLIKYRFDEFHNFGLEKQTKAEGKIITKMSSKYLCMILVYVTLTKYFAPKFSIGRV